MVDFESFYLFLMDRYLHSRFEGRNGPVWGNNYSDIVARSAYEYLKKHGQGWISMYESNTGRPVHYDINLNILNPDEPPSQIQAKSGHLTHIISH